MLSGRSAQPKRRGVGTSMEATCHNSDLVSFCGAQHASRAGLNISSRRVIISIMDFS